MAPAAETNVFCEVVVDIDVAHLDDAFDYSVPQELQDDVFVGSLVHVRFGRRRLSGFVRALKSSSGFTGKITPILRVVSPLPVVSPGLFEVVDYLALRHAGTRSQVLSFVVPPRRARVENSLSEEIAAAKRERSGIFAEAAGGPKTDSDEAPRVRQVRTVLPGGRTASILELAHHHAPDAGNILVLASSAKDVADIAQELRDNSDYKVGITDADQGPDRRYRAYLEALLGKYDILVGSRSAAWIPMAGLKAILIWDDGDDRFREPRSPHLDTLDIAVARAHLEKLSLVSAAYSRSIKSQALVESGWAQQVEPANEDALARIPKVAMFDAHSAEREGATGMTRLPEAAFRTIRKGLETGPVLISVTASGGTTELEDGRLRVGSDRIRDELARAFPHVPARVSSSTSEVLRDIGSSPQIVVATAGAEPATPGGYAAMVFTNASQSAYWSSLDAPLEALRRWMNALALAAPRSPALLVGDVTADTLDSLVYWRPRILASAQLEQRQMLGFPPARWALAITGAPASVDSLMRNIESTLGHAEAHFPGTPFPSLVLVSDSGTSGEDRQIIISVAPRRIRKLMEQVARGRWELSRQNRPLPRVVTNPPSLVEPNTIRTHGRKKD